MGDMNNNFLKQRFIKSWIILANAATDGYFCVQMLKKQSKYSVASLYNILLQIFCKLKFFTITQFAVIIFLLTIIVADFVNIRIIITKMVR